MKTLSAIALVVLISPCQGFKSKAGLLLTYKTSLLAGSVYGDPPSQTTEADNHWHPPLHPRALATRLLAGCLLQRCSWPAILEGNQFFPFDAPMNSLATRDKDVFLSLGF